MFHDVYFPRTPLWVVYSFYLQRVWAERLQLIYTLCCGVWGGAHSESRKREGFRQQKPSTLDPTEEYVRPWRRIRGTEVECDQEAKKEEKKEDEEQDFVMKSV